MILRSSIIQFRFLNFINYDKHTYENHIQQIEEINIFLKNDVFAKNAETEIKIIKEILQDAFQISQFENIIQNVLYNSKKDLDAYLSSESIEQQTKQNNIENLLACIRNYTTALLEFEKLNCRSYRIVTNN
jgi:hypothetical protein